jgi:hypothetical protein
MPAADQASVGAAASDDDIASARWTPEQAGDQHLQPALGRDRGRGGRRSGGRIGGYARIVKTDGDAITLVVPNLGIRGDPTSALRSRSHRSIKLF